MPENFPHQGDENNPSAHPPQPSFSSTPQQPTPGQPKEDPAQTPGQPPSYDGQPPAPLYSGQGYGQPPPALEQLHDAPHAQQPGQQPYGEQPYGQQPPRKKRTALIVGIVGGVLALVVIIGLVLFLVLRSSVGAPTEVADDFVAAFADGDYEKSSAMLSEGFLKETSKSEYKTFLESQSPYFDGDRSTKGIYRTTQDSRTVASVVYKFDSSHVPSIDTVYIQVLVEEIDGKWEVLGVRVAENSLDADDIDIFKQ